VFIPLSWLALSIVLYLYFGWKIAVVSIPFSFLCGYISLRTLEEIEELRGWFNAILVFFSKREKFLRLLVERKELNKEISGEM
jgi:hypothetical protein